VNGPRPRVALGLSPSSVTGLFLLPAGVAVGPHGLRLLSPPVLSYLDPAVPVALAALGVLVGLGLGVRRPPERRSRLLSAASFEAGLTILLVGAAVLFVYRAAPPTGLASWLLALVLGICASTSSTVVVDDADDPGAATRQAVGFDNVLPIVLGGVALAFVQKSDIAPAFSLTAQASAVFLIIALIGWLLITRSSSEREQQVFAIATLLLIGGAAEYLSLSALLAGLIAGLFWGFAGGPARDRLHREVLHLQHPLLVFVLLVAGARADISVSLLGLATIYLVLRVTGKLAGEWAARRMRGADGPQRLGTDLIAPGILGVAFALNVLRAGGPDTAPVLAVAVAGTFGSELLTLMVRHTEARE
jgi:hypothetical protein